METVISRPNPNRKQKLRTCKQRGNDGAQFNWKGKTKNRLEKAYGLLAVTVAKLIAHKLGFTDSVMAEEGRFPEIQDFRGPFERILPWFGEEYNAIMAQKILAKASVKPQVSPFVPFTVRKVQNRLIYMYHKPGNTEEGRDRTLGYSKEHPSAENQHNTIWGVYYHTIGPIVEKYVSAEKPISRKTAMKMLEKAEMEHGLYKK